MAKKSPRKNSWPEYTFQCPNPECKAITHGTSDKRGIVKIKCKNPKCGVIAVRHVKRDERRLDIPDIFYPDPQEK